MRLIFMRHGESQNNILAKIDRTIYQERRVYEPELSELGVSECKQLGQAVKAAGIQIDLVLTSAHKRALLSARHVLESFDADTPV